MSTDCYCVDYDAPSVFREAKRKARKDHQCCECHGVIRKGETYEHVSGLWDDHWSTYRTCPDCLHLRCQTGCDCWIYGDMANATSGDERLLGMFKAIIATRSPDTTARK